jgi:hypothetical protein
MDEFLKAIAEFQTDPVPPVEFRVYYRPDGSIIGYTTEHWEGDYITVDKQVFHENRHDLRVKNNKLIYPKISIGKLRPSTQGTPCHPRDITIIVNDSHPSQNWKNYTYED